VLRSDKFIVKWHKRSLREMKGSSAAIGEEGMCYARSLETYKKRVVFQLRVYAIYRAMGDRQPF